MMVKPKYEILQFKTSTEHKSLKTNGMWYVLKTIKNLDHPNSEIRRYLSTEGEWLKVAADKLGKLLGYFKTKEDARKALLKYEGYYYLQLHLKEN